MCEAAWLGEMDREGERMRYVIIGAGAIGGTIGGRLHQAGHEVVLVARGEHLRQLRSRGLQLVTPDGEYALGVPTAAGPEDLVLTPDDVLVLAVKSQDTQSALRTWADAPVDGGTTAGAQLPLVAAQNGVANERMALRLFRHVYGMGVWLPATFLEPGRIVAEGAPLSGMLILGRYPTGTDTTAEKIAADLRSSRIAAYAEPDVMRWKYGKLLVNVTNGLDALSGTTAAGGTAEVAERLREEARAVFVAGITYASWDEVVQRNNDQVQLNPSDHGNSTWQSLARGTGEVEVDYLNGEIVLLGRLHGVPTPVNEAVQSAARQAAARHKAPGSYSMADLTALARMAA
jgi:2-dehydropantoate 2-reductase